MADETRDNSDSQGDQPVDDQNQQGFSFSRSQVGPEPGENEDEQLRSRPDNDVDEAAEVALQAGIPVSEQFRTLLDEAELENANNQDREKGSEAPDNDLDEAAEVALQTASPRPHRCS